MKALRIAALVLLLSAPGCEAFIPGSISGELEYLGKERDATSQRVNELGSEVQRLSKGLDVPWLSESDKALIDMAIARQGEELARAKERLEKIDSIIPEVEGKAKESASLAVQEQIWDLLSWLATALGIGGVGSGLAMAQGRRARRAREKIEAAVVGRVNTIRGPPRPDQSGGGSPV